MIVSGGIFETPTVRVTNPDVSHYVVMQNVSRDGRIDWRYAAETTKRSSAMRIALLMLAARQQTVPTIKSGPKPNPPKVDFVLEKIRQEARERLAARPKLVETVVEASPPVVEEVEKPKRKTKRSGSRNKKPQRVVA